MMIQKSLSSILLLILSLIVIFTEVKAADPSSTAPQRAIIDVRRSAEAVQKPGSVLVFNFYTSSPGVQPAFDTVFFITNTNPDQGVNLHFFFVGQSGSVADYITCLAPNQALEFKASVLDPGYSGYLIAIARDPKTGLPMAFNHLTGSEFVRMESGHTANLPAESYPAYFSGIIPGFVNGSPTVEMLFDGTMYPTVGMELAADQIRRPSDGFSTLLVINSLRGKLTNSLSSMGNINGVVYADNATAIPFTVSPGAQIATILSDKFPLTNPKFPEIIGPGKTGWMRILSGGGAGICGAVINFSQNTAGVVLNGGHNLARLRQTSSVMTYPVFNATCN